MTSEWEFFGTLPEEVQGRPLLERLLYRIGQSAPPAYFGPGSLWEDLLEAIDAIKANASQRPPVAMVKGRIWHDGDGHHHFVTAEEDAEERRRVEEMGYAFFPLAESEYRMYPQFVAEQFTAAKKVVGALRYSLDAMSEPVPEGE